MPIIKRKDYWSAFLLTFGGETVKAANCDACFLFDDIDMDAYASVIVADVLAAAIVAAAPCIHGDVAVALVFASVDDVVVSYLK